MGRLVPLGEKATQEMIADDIRNPVFDSAAALAGRKAGLTDEEIVELLGYLPPPLFPPEVVPDEESSGEMSIAYKGR